MEILFSAHPELFPQPAQHPPVTKGLLILIHSISSDLGVSFFFFWCKITYMLECFPPPEICHLIVSLGLFSTTLLTPFSSPPLQDRRQSPLESCN